MKADEMIEHFVADMRLNLDSSRRGALNLGTNYSADDSEHRIELSFQEALNQQARGLFCAILELSGSDLTISSLGKIKQVYAEASQLLNGSRYGEFIQERLANLGELEKEWGFAS